MNQEHLAIMFTHRCQMGSGPSTYTSEAISHDLGTISDRNVSQQDRKPAFDRLRTELAPTLQNTNPKAYAHEVAGVFALRYPGPWVSEAECQGWSEDARRVLADRVRGLVFGCALGDAMGLATEFLSKKEVETHYDTTHERWIPGCESMYADTHRINFPKGDWTDDTDQMLLILHSLLATEARCDPCDFAARLCGWRESGFPGLGDQSGAGLGTTTKQVMTQPDFKMAPIQAAQRVWERSGRSSAPNGAVMRTAIVGAATFWDRERTEQNTLDFCRTTHADPKCAFSCIAVTDLIGGVLRATIAQDSPDRKCERGFDLDVWGLVTVALQRAAVVSQCGADTEAELHSLLQSPTLAEMELDSVSMGYTLKCVACALHTLTRAQTQRLSFVEAMGLVVAEGGDADTNAAVTGAVLGCVMGFSQLPELHIRAMPYCVWLEAWVQKVLYMLRLPVPIEEGAQLTNSTHDTRQSQGHK